MTDELPIHPHQACLDACNECADACDRCAAACLAEPAPTDMTDCIRVNADCAALCKLATGFIARNSRYAGEVCDLCADICIDSAEICGRHDAPHCTACAAACVRCAEECRRVAEDCRAGASAG